MTTKIFSLTALLALPILVQEPAKAPSPDSAQAQRARSQLHYRTVIGELRAASDQKSPPEIAASRARLIDELERYAERADFGIAPPGSDGRPVVFVDDDGRRCAVAELLHATGRDALVERVRSTNNLAWVAELAADEELAAWLGEHGLSAFDAARIQGPSIGWGSIPGGAPEGTRAARPRRNEEEVARPRARTDSASNPGSQPTTGAAPTGPSVATSTATAPTRPGAPTGVDAPAEDGWWMWWELNKAEFLRPKRISLANATWDGVGDGSSSLEQRRMSWMPRLAAALADPDAQVRGAAVLALGRLGDDDAVERIVPLLTDASREVRERAILALGSTGAPRALRPLSSLIRTGALENGTRVSADAQAYAILGAALGRTRTFGFPAELDAIVTVSVRERKPADAETIGCAAMIYQALAPSSSLEKLAFELASDEKESIPVRCRAIEALRRSHDERTLPLLQNLLFGSRLELRRSAALALGEVANPLALAVLMTASELEAESLTRGFVLVSIGRRGGEKARDFLVGQLRNGPSTHRSWAALGLGLVAWRNDVPGIAKDLREALAREKNRNAEGALCIALGLARDPAAVEPLGGIVAGSAHAQTRAYAATALGLIDGEGAHATLRTYVADERQPQARVTAAFALASLGGAEDVGVLRGVLADMRSPDLEAAAAGALAFHGSLEALGVLEQAAEAPREQALARSGALDGLGLMLDDAAPYRLGDAVRQSNHATMAPWMQGALTSSL